MEHRNPPFATSHLLLLPPKVGPLPPSTPNGQVQNRAPPVQITLEFLPHGSFFLWKFSPPAFTTALSDEKMQVPCQPTSADPALVIMAKHRPDRFSFFLHSTFRYPPFAIPESSFFLGFEK